MPVLIKDDDTFKKAHAEYKRFTADDAMLDAIEAHEKWVKDNNSRMHAAREDGIKQGKLNVAKALIKEKMSPEKISQITGLSLDEIGKL